jgi:putative transposase
MHLEYPPKLSVIDLVKRLKGHTSRKLQQEYPWIEKRYWGVTFGPQVTEHGVQVT